MLCRFPVRKLPIPLSGYTNKNVTMKGEMKMSIMQMLEGVIEEMCNNYCKYPDIYAQKYGEDEAGEKLCEEACMNCPLTEI